MSDTYSPFTWIFVCATFLSLFVAYGIGANDVANAFGSSVGAKALTMKQAIVIAAVCEFSGAVALGAGVTNTIRSNIADLKAYADKPDLYMYGMLCALLATGIWLILATYLELPVSTTHSIVGSVIGMAMVTVGADNVVWSKEKDDFPFLDGVSVIVISWFTSPLLAGIVGAGLFLVTRHAVLRRENSFQKSLWVLPVLAFITIYVCCFYIIQKAPKLADKVDESKNAWISACFASGAALFAIFIGIPLVKRAVAKDLAEEEDAAQAKADAKTKTMESGSDGSEAEVPAVGAGHPERTPAGLTDMRKSKMFNALTKSANFDIHGVIDEDEKINEMHGAAEQFDRKTELSFKYLQVVTAMTNSFAHGSNDVANAIGPYAGIYAVWQCTCVESKSTVPEWILVIGGVGLVLGLATYGYKIMRVLGVKMVKLTNSRGYCVELASAAVIIVGSRYGLPLSTTHCLVGAVTGIGVVETVSGRRPEGSTSTRSAFNWLLLLKFFCGWVATLVIAGLTSAAFTAQGVYAPYKPGTDNRVTSVSTMNETALSVANYLSTTQQYAGLGQELLAACNSTIVTDPAVNLDGITSCVDAVMSSLNDTLAA